MKGDCVVLWEQSEAGGSGVNEMCQILLSFKKQVWLSRSSHRCLSFADNNEHGKKVAFVFNRRNS